MVDYQLKIIFDFRCGSAGGVLRDSSGRVVMTFAQSLGRTSSVDHAEMRALSLGLKIIVGAGFNPCFVESDCLSMVNKIRMEEIDPGPASLCYKELNTLYSGWLSSFLSHCSRSSNKAAHANM